jgi:hypothetical protein
MKTGTIALVWMAVALTACGGSSSDDTNSGNGALSGGGAKPAGSASAAAPKPSATTTPPPAKMLKDEITACQAVEKKGEDAQSTVEMVEAEGAVADCYRTAVDGHASAIDAIRKQNGGMQLAPATATAKGAFDDYRANKSASGAAPTTLCAIGDASSSNFGGTLQRVEDAGCAAAVETRLAKLVAGVTTLPGNPVALTGSDATADDLQPFVPKLVGQMNENTPGDQAAYTAQVQATLAGVVASSGELCALLEDAGEMGGGTGAQQLVGSCMSKALGMIKDELTDWTGNPEGQ